MKTKNSWWFLIFFCYCFAGGYLEKGGHIDTIEIFPDATNIYSDQYVIVCPKLPSSSREQSKPMFQYIPKEKYKGGCEQYGEVSQFYLFHLIPISGKLDPNYAITIPVQNLEGDSMIHIRAWHETHYYSILGKVRVFKVKGDVIKFQK